ncbi:WGR and DUF4132 domain-containing protein [Goodfellowiella coeruleoviolacea]|uniref:WGR domain-containing protein, predicted DNA-binding domain in MolR n=1 Tax=Goodfellowiella coeruleoviolacea TaxID=334858 RepID=A0AAE3GB31_9PSEU|nr:DUF4132 domain-containing protein [Goodfellowiella coeruleoviolacea]MCP2164022.1 WGR domain-containing protein, predicted DNA-binding domain in MolR [Goodfellowiella coeruleoviolacea]
MRRFEYVAERSEKFWEIDLAGRSVTVRYGRMGTSGQTQTKELASPSAAQAHHDKLVADKVRKGYQEVAAPNGALPAAARPSAQEDASLPAAAAATEPSAEPVDLAEQLASEDVLDIPPAWRRTLHPRRGGVPGPRVVLDQRAAETLWQHLDVEREQLAPNTLRGVIQRILDSPDTDPELAAQGRAYLDHATLPPRDHESMTPLGAAAVARAFAHSLNWHEDDRLGGLTDAWLTTHGVVFTARAVVELVGLVTAGDDASAVHLRPWAPGDNEHVVLRGAVRTAIYRLRAFLAQAGDDDYHAVTEALADYRGGCPLQRIVVSFLLPTRTDWVSQDCATAASTGDATGVDLLLCSLTSVEQLDQVADLFNTWLLWRYPAPLPTLVEGVGAGAAATLARWLDKPNHAADISKRLLATLAALPSDEALDHLLNRVDQKYVQPVVLDALRRYPARGLRLLAAKAAANSSAARTAAALLRSHVLARPTLVTALLPALPAALRERIEAITESSGVAEAPAESLPSVLVSPPWLSRPKAVQPTVITGLVAPETTEIAWQPGEQEEWANQQTWFDRWTIRADRDWADLAAEFTTGKIRNAVAFMVKGPEEVVRPLLRDWRPRDTYSSDGWLRRLIGRYGLDALGPAMHVARHDPRQGATVLLMPFASTEIALLMADWFTRLKSVRQAALAWFHRHPEVAARGLVPTAVGSPGKQRRAAESALRAIASGGHATEVLRAAAHYGEQAVEVVRSILDTDPLQVLPPRIPALPAWLEPGTLPQILLADRAQALPRTAIQHLCTMLAMSTPDDVYAGVDIVRDACDRESLAEFGWALFQSWQSAGMPAKDGWVLTALGWLGDDETVRLLTPLIRAWPGVGGHARAVAGLDVLASIGTDVALMHLHGIAQKVKFRALRERAQDKVNQIAEELGLTAEQLADRLVPDLGLNPDGSLTLDYGPRRFVVGFDEQLKPYVTDENGTRRKDLPKPGARDDQDLAPAAHKRFAALKKDARAVVADQLRRLERAMVTQRRWPAAEFRALFVDHPLIWHLVRRLVWASYDEAGHLVRAFRVAEDRTLADVNDDSVELGEDTVGIAHPLHLGADLDAWSEVFADYEILQPFPQLGRDTHHLTDEERATHTITRFAGRTVPTVKVIGLERRGWVRGAPQDAGVQCWTYLPIAAGRTVTISLDPGIIPGEPAYWPEQKLTDIWLSTATHGDWRPPAANGEVTLGTLDPVVVSELLRDLTDLTR